MVRQTLIWTALPNGIRNNKLQLSAFLSPRLTSDGVKPSLADFPDFLTWPVVPLTFQVQFAKGPVLQATRVSPAPDLALWGKLFSANTVVRSYIDQNESNTTVISYSVLNVLGFVHDRYHKLALEYPTRLPPAGRILDKEFFGMLRVAGGALTAQLKSVRAAMRTEQAQVVRVMQTAYEEAVSSGQGDVTPPIVPAPGSGVDSGLPTGVREHIEAVIKQNQQQAGSQISSGFLDRFGDRSGDAPKPDTKPAYRPGDGPVDYPLIWPSDRVPNPLRDFLRADLFHRGMSPELTGGPSDRSVQPIPMIPEIDFHKGIALLGSYPTLLRRLGLVIDLEVPLDPGIPADSTLRVLPSWGAKVDTINVSAWTNYSMRTSRTLFLARPRPTYPELKDGLLDLADQEKFGLIQTDPDSAAASILSLMNSRVDPSKPEAEVGLPVLRSAGISLIRSGAGIVLLQSFVLNSLNNRRLHDNRHDIVFYAEDLVRGYRPDIYSGKSQVWHSLTGRIGTYELVDTGYTETLQDEGWVSLGATRALSSAVSDLHVHEMLFNWQGWSLAAPPLEQAVDSSASGDSLLTALRMRINFKVPPSSLPMLRYGINYRVRARMVDLAGNSVPFLANADLSGANPSDFAYRRLEAITSPPVIPRENPAMGATQTRILVRTKVDAQGQTTTDSESPAHERHILPPSTSIKQAEIHGIFDTPVGMDLHKYQEALTRHGSLAEVVAAANPDLPYLPDVFARYASFRGLPGVIDVYTVDFASTATTWPDAKPFRLQLKGVDKASPEGVIWDAATRILTVNLRPGSQFKVPVSAGFKPANVTDPSAPAYQAALTALQSMFLWGTLTDSERTQFQTDALHGKLWMLTPAKELTLVHAVQKPLEAPKIVVAQASRAPKETTALISGRVTVHGATTSHVLINADWNVILDDPDYDDPADLSIPPGPKVVAQTGLGLQEAVAEGDTEITFLDRHNLGDTHHKKIVYTAVAMSRFKEYFPDVEDDGTSFITPHVTDATTLATLSKVVDVPSSAPPAPPKVAYVVPTVAFEPNVVAETVRPVDEVAQTLKRTGVKEYTESVYEPGTGVIYTRGSDYTIDYSAGTITRVASGRIINGAAVNIDYTYMTDDGTKQVSLRKGGGVRVYLERPWYSSGIGELLGVVLLDGLSSRSRVPEVKQPFVTHWGQDPLRRGGATHRQPRVEHFPRAVAVQSGLTLRELDAGSSVTVVGHQVYFDPDRKLWYCDIAIDPGAAYYPFVRLALVRYQPDSILGAHISTVTLADYIQVSPDRATTVTYTAADRSQARVTVAGETYDRSDSGPALVEVAVEKLTVAAGSPSLNWQPSGMEPVMLVRKRGYWSGLLDLPQAVVGERLRLVVAEYEPYKTDSPDRLGQGTAYIKRVIFADIIAVEGRK